MNTPGQRIKDIRTQQLGKMSQEKFGKYAGVTKAAVSQWERDITTPERDPLLKLQRSLSINPDYIINGSGDIFIKPASGNVQETASIYMRTCIDEATMKEAIAFVEKTFIKNNITADADEKAGIIFDTYLQLRKRNDRQ